MDTLQTDGRLICPYCQQPFTPRRGGRRQIFCSPAHRIAAWKEAYRRGVGFAGGAGGGQSNVQSNITLLPEGSAPKAGHAPTNACRWCGTALPTRDPRVCFCDRACQNSWWGALRWVALEDFQAGRLTIERLHEVDARFRAEAAAQAAERDRRKAERAARPKRRLCRRRPRRAPPPSPAEPEVTPTTTEADHGKRSG